VTADGFANPLTDKMARFLKEIGLAVRAGAVVGPTALPGIDVAPGVLIVDEAGLLYPGDLLHEAGHLAVVPPARRADFHHDAGNIPAEEMAAIAWSYAAARHIGIDAALVFHEHGYRGDGPTIVENFDAGRFIGTPILDHAGMAHDGARRTPEGAKPYPHMIRWLREA
jgi:hypothetical protein